jgi:hypothetical protein
MHQVGITPETSWGMVESLLQPQAQAIVSGIYRDLVAQYCRHGILLIWDYLPMSGVVVNKLKQRN